MNWPAPAQLNVPDQLAVCILHRPDNSHGKTSLGQLVSRHDATRAHNLLVQEPIQVVAEFGRIVQAEKDGRVRPGVWNIQFVMPCFFNSG